MAALSGLDRVLKGASAAISRVREEVQDLAGLDVPVMVVGRNGTGKEVVAQSLHDLAGAAGAFVAWIARRCRRGSLSV